MILLFSKHICNHRCLTSGILCFDAKYVFSDLGYNFLPSEISAAFALVQLKKLKNNIAIRNKNFDYLKRYFKQYNHLFDLPEQYPGVITPWLAFPLVIKKNKYFKKRNENEEKMDKKTKQTKRKKEKDFR